MTLSLWLCEKSWPLPLALVLLFSLIVLGLFRWKVVPLDLLSLSLVQDQSWCILEVASLRTCCHWLTKGYLSVSSKQGEQDNRPTFGWRNRGCWRLFELRLIGRDCLWRLWLGGSIGVMMSQHLAQWQQVIRRRSHQLGWKIWAVSKMSVEVNSKLMTSHLIPDSGAFLISRNISFCRSVKGPQENNRRPEGETGANGTRESFLL